MNTFQILTNVNERRQLCGISDEKIPPHFVDLIHHDVFPSFFFLLFFFIQPWIFFCRPGPSFIYSWSINHVLEHELDCLGHLVCQGNNMKVVFFFFFTALKRQMANTEEFMFQNVVYRPTVYKTGTASLGPNISTYLISTHVSNLYCKVAHNLPVR